MVKVLLKKKVAQNPPGLFRRQTIHQKLLNPGVVFYCKPEDDTQGKRSRRPHCIAADLKHTLEHVEVLGQTI